MPLFNETGHAINVANFYDLKSRVAGFGPAYNPQKTALKLPQLTTLHSNANTAIATVLTANTVYNNAVNDRMSTFKPLKPLATRIIAALSATDATIEQIKDAKTINRKLQGRRAKAIPAPVNPNDPVPANISASQQSYDSLVQHFLGLIALLSSIPSYIPSEPDLEIASLTTLSTTLAAKNQLVADAFTTVTNARIARNEILYNNPAGIYYIANSVKQYVKSVFNASSPQYKDVTAIKFTKPR